MDSFFTCSPNCTVENLAAMDWLVVAGLFIVIYSVSTVWRKGAFSWNKYPETSIKWHVPRFIYIAFVLAVVTIPLVWWLFGYIWAKVYGQFIFPECALVAYFLWVMCSEKHNRPM